MTKSNNHLYPAFHIRKWVDQGGKIYDKKKAVEKRIRRVNPRKDFSAVYYYSLGEKDDGLENRISSFECEIAPLIEQIDTATESVNLKRKQLELLKLYCSLCANRHSNTCEVIKSDESGIYRSNHYLIGTHRIETQKDAVEITTRIVKEFERIREASKKTNQDNSKQYVNAFTLGLHLAIFRSETPMVMISDRFCILENTIDSDHLFSYIPVSPRTALLLVKSKYYYDFEHFESTCIRFGNKYGLGTPDPYLSDLLGAEVGLYEDRLFRAAYKDELMIEPADDTCESLYVKIQKLPKEVFRLFNSIYCEDGEKVLYCDKKELEYALSHQLNCRDIKVSL